MAAVSLTVNGKPVTADVDTRTLLVSCCAKTCGSPAPMSAATPRNAAPASSTSTARRPSRAPCWRCRSRRQCADHRGAGPVGDAAASDAGGVPREPRPAMRLLHARHDHDRGRYRAPQGQRFRRPTIREELEGNICRCTGYHNIVKAIAAGAKAMRGGTGASQPPNNQGRAVGTATGCPGERIAGGQCHERNRDGASVRRKEDQRFITGKGHYTDDINRPGQAAIYFIRSPHAHAKIKSIDTAAAAKMPGVAGVFTGKSSRKTSSVISFAAGRCCRKTARR